MAVDGRCELSVLGAEEDPDPSVGEDALYSSIQCHGEMSCAVEFAVGMVAAVDEFYPVVRVGGSRCPAHV